MIIHPWLSDISLLSLFLYITYTYTLINNHSCISIARKFLKWIYCRGKNKFYERKIILNQESCVGVIHLLNDYLFTESEELIFVAVL